MIRSTTTGGCTLARRSTTQALRRLPRAGLLLGLAVLPACVSARDYDDAKALAAHYQEQVLDRDKVIADLQAQLEKQKRAFATSEVNSLSSAGYGGDLDERLSELQAKIDGLGRPLKDVERFDVEGGYVVMVQDKILFDSGSAELSAEGRKILAEEAAKIAATPHGRVWVRGHTDSDPVAKPATKEKFPHGNLELSAARAIEVAAELIESKKVPAKDVVVAGFGQHDPLKKNDGADNKRLNRRVEIFVSDRPAAASAKPAATADAKEK